MNNITMTVTSSLPTWIGLLDTIIAAIALVINITFVFLGLRHLQKTFHNLFVLCLCANDAIVSVALISFVCVKQFVKTSIPKEPCVMLIIVMVYGYSMCYTTIFLICFTRCFAIKKFNYGIKEKMERHKYVIMMVSAAFISFVTIVSSVVFMKNGRVDHCSIDGIYGDNYRTFIGVVWAPISVLGIAVVFMYVLSSYWLWKVFFVRENQVRPMPPISFRNLRIDSDNKIDTMTCTADVHVVKDDKADDNQEDVIPEKMSREIYGNEIVECAQIHTTSSLMESKDIWGQRSRKLAITDTVEEGPTFESERINGTGSAINLKDISVLRSDKIEEYKTVEELPTSECVYKTGASDRSDLKDISVLSVREIEVNETEEELSTSECAHINGTSAVIDLNDISIQRYSSTQSPAAKNATNDSKVLEKQRTVCVENREWELRAFKTNLITMVTTTVLTFPLMMVYLYELFSGVIVSQDVKHGVFILNAVNFILDPFIYAYRVPEIKKELQKHTPLI